MEKFDDRYDLLKDMYMNTYYPEEFVDEIYQMFFKVINMLEEGERDTVVIHESLNELTCGINKLKIEFLKQDSQLENEADVCIRESLQFVLEFFTVDINLDGALSQEKW